MSILKVTTVVLTAFFFSAGTAVSDRLDRIEFRGQELFVSGANVAWIDFARDIGPGQTKLDQFEAIFKELSANGGNTMRFWLHTDGRNTPAWEGHKVVGPGEGAIEDLKNILDRAQRHNIGLMLCLWSFDMLRLSHGQMVTDRAYAILTEADKYQLYIDNALIPMVAALKGHPAIFAWEIFNEAEGMSHEFGWEFNRRVPMSDIQRFVNRTAGAIRRADPGVKITNGTWSFLALTDVLKDGKAANYYTDERLIAAGGDPAGTLDFYTVHYYKWGRERLSPFHHDFSHWQLDKPVVVAEFYAKEDLYGVSKTGLYEELYHRGYAGALGWQWVDHFHNRNDNQESWPNILINMSKIVEKYPEDVRLTLPKTSARREK